MSSRAEANIFIQEHLRLKFMSETFVFTGVQLLVGAVLPILRILNPIREVAQSLLPQQPNSCFHSPVAVSGGTTRLLFAIQSEPQQIDLQLDHNGNDDSTQMLAGRSEKCSPPRAVFCQTILTCLATNCIYLRYL